MKAKTKKKTAKKVVGVDALVIKQAGIWNDKLIEYLHSDSLQFSWTERLHDKKPDDNCHLFWVLINYIYNYYPVKFKELQKRYSIIVTP